MKGAHIERALLLIPGAIAAACLTPAMCSAETATVRASEQTIMEELRAQEDPTIFTRRMWADTEWNKYKDGSHDVDETLGLLWAWRVSESQEWAVRLKVPLKVAPRRRNGWGFQRFGTGQTSDVRRQTSDKT